MMLFKISLTTSTFLPPLPLLPPLLLLLLLLPQTTEAVKCYQCSAEDNFCADWFNPNATGVKICEGNFCFKSAASFYGLHSASERGCAEAVNFEGCQPVNGTGVSTIACTCKTNYCNGSVSLKSSSDVKVAFTIGVLAISFLLNS